MKLNERESKSLKRRIRIAERYYDDKRKQLLKRALALYTGEHYDNMKLASARARLIVNYILHIVETKVHGIAFKYPQFHFIPKTPLGEQNLPVTEVAVPFEYKQAYAQYEAKRCLKDKEIYGNGVCYTGWLFETDDGQRMEDGRDSAPTAGVFGGDYGMPPDMGMEGMPPPEQTDLTYPPEQPDQATTGATVRNDRFFVKRISPCNFFVSPECGRCLEDAEYCGYWECRPVEEVKSDPRYKNVRQLKGTAENLKGWFDELIRKEAGADYEDTPTDLKRVKLYHYYEKKRRIHAIFCDEHDKPLYMEEWTHQWDRYPFRTLQGPGDEDEFWAQPLTLLLEHPQKELNEARSQLSDIRRTSQSKYQVAGGQLTAKSIKQLQSADPNVVVEHNGTIPASIVPIAQQPVQPAIFQTEQVVLADIQNIAAVSQYQLGNAPTKRTTTSEVEAITSQGGARAAADRQDFEEFCAGLASDCLKWLQQYAVKTRELPVYNDASVVQGWQEFSRQQIAGDYDVEVYVNSMSPPNDQEDVQAIGFFMQSLAPILQLMPVAMQSGVNLLPLLKQLLKALPNIRNVDEILQGMQPTIPAMGNPMAAAGGTATGGLPVQATDGAIPQAGQIPQELLMQMLAQGGM